MVIGARRTRRLRQAADRGAWDNDARDQRHGLLRRRAGRHQSLSSRTGVNFPPLNTRRAAVALSLTVILAAALAVRLAGVRFGLPALYDPDEPLFMLAALKLLRERTLNPGWFGHPGTTTIYGIAVVEVATYLIGHAAGVFPTTAAFIRAVYLDPGLVWLPARLMIVGCGVACVGLTYLVGRRAFGVRTGLVAAAVLAINALHVEWSEIVRTDVHATVFMLLSVLGAIGIVRHGRWRDYLWAGAMVGVACATKWPAATVVAAMASAAAVRIAAQPGDKRPQLVRLAAGMAAALAALLLTSPYLLLDYRTVIADLGGEVAVQHLGATGGTPLANFQWYLWGPLRQSFGYPALIAAATGAVIAVRATRLGWTTIVAPAALFLLMICTQALVWTRWVVPVLPFIALAASVAVVAAVDRLRASLPVAAAAMATAVLAAVVSGPMLLALHDQIGERQSDTRTEASRWLIAHAPRGTPVAVEHIAFDLFNAGYPVRFPMGHAGCQDAMALLTGHMTLAGVGAMRGNVAVADFGTVDPAKRSSCNAGYVVLSHYDRYLADGSHFRREIAAYELIRRAGTEVASFLPRPGEVGGPVVRVIRLRSQAVRP